VSARSRTVEEIVAEIASRQHGVAARRQLLASGVSRDQIADRLRRGALIQEYRGVYRVGHRAPSVEAAYMAAVLACGPGSLIAGRAAAYQWRLIKGPPPLPEVIALTERKALGIITHRARRQPGADSGLRFGIPVTTVARTLVDLAAALNAEELAAACHEAGVLHKTTPAQVDRVLRRRPSSRGAGMLRRVMKGDKRVTLSRLEARFLYRLRSAGLPLPVTNKSASGRRVDCRWPEHRLTVELDSYEFHNSRHAWERDHRREREARARGDDFRRFTWGDVFEHPETMIRELQAFFRPGRPGQ
jgi:hypothetical protein